jgi:hypothetical protein
VFGHEPDDVACDEPEDCPGVTGDEPEDVEAPWPGESVSSSDELELGVVLGDVDGELVTGLCGVLDDECDVASDDSDDLEEPVVVCTVPFQRAVPATTATAALTVLSSVVISRARRVPRVLPFIMTPFRGCLVSTVGGRSSNFLSWTGTAQRISYVVAVHLVERVGAA